MVVEEADEEPLQEPQARGPLADHPKVRLAALVVSTVAGVGALLYLLFPGMFPVKPSGPTGAASTASTSMPAFASTTSSASDVDRPSVGDCLTVETAVVNCSEPHALEIVGDRNIPCDHDTLVRYLGGVGGVDVLDVNPSSGTVGITAGRCVVALPDGAPNAVSARDALRRGRSGDVWRRCVDTAIDDDRVACSLPHTGEYIGLVPGSINCEEAFEAYTQLPFAQVSDRLSLARVQPSGVSSQSCRVSVLGHNVLTESLRDLRTRALPVEAR